MIWSAPTRRDDDEEHYYQIGYVWVPAGPDWADGHWCLIPGQPPG